MPRGRANLFLIQIRFAQRAADAQLAAGFSARTKVPGVIRIESIYDCGETARRCDLYQRAINMLFTEVTAVSGIRGITRIGHFVGFNQDERNTYLLQSIDRFLLFISPETRGYGDYGQDIFCAEHIQRELGHQSAVDSAGIGDYRALQLAEDLLHSVEFGLNRFGELG